MKDRSVACSKSLLYTNLEAIPPVLSKVTIRCRLKAENWNMDLEAVETARTVTELQVESELDSPFFSLLHLTLVTRI